MTAFEESLGELASSCNEFFKHLKEERKQGNFNFFDQEKWEGIIIDKAMSLVIGKDWEQQIDNIKKID